MEELLAEIDSARTIEADADDAAALACRADCDRQRLQAARALDRGIDAADALLDSARDIALSARIVDLASTEGLRQTPALLEARGRYHACAARHAILDDEEPDGTETGDQHRLCLGNRSVQHAAKRKAGRVDA